MKKIKFQSLMTWNNSHVFVYQKEATPYLKNNYENIMKFCFINNLNIFWEWKKV